MEAVESIVEIQIPDVDEPIKVPIIYKDAEASDSWYESLSLSTVVEHKDGIYKLRMPGAKNYVDKNIQVHIHDASVKEESFHHDIDKILDYRRVKLEQSSEEKVQSSILDPYTNEEDTASSSNEIIRKITLDCFALELGGSSHYLIYIAGRWFISFSNFFKFFSEDYRRKNIDSIAKAVRKLDGKGDYKYYVQRAQVDALIAETYPIWSGYNENRLNLIGTRQFYDADQIKDIIKKHMSGESINNISPYPETQWERGKDKAFEKEVKKIVKSVDVTFWKYVSVRPAYDTKDRFDRNLKNMGLNPEEYYTNLQQDIAIQRIESSDEDTSDDSSDDDSSDDIAGEYVFTDITHADVKSWVGDEVDEYAKRFTNKLLKEMNIIPDDIDSIAQEFYNQDVPTLFKLQEVMQDRANIKPGKFDLFVKLAKAAGANTSIDDPETVLEELQEQLREAENEIKALAIRKAYLVEFINKPDDDPGVAEDQERAADERTQSQFFNVSQVSTFTKSDAIREMQEIDTKFAEMRKQNKVSTLKREIHAMKDPDWVSMRHVLAKIGVKASNKAAVKLNAVFSIEEFYDMLTVFSGDIDKDEIETALSERKKELELERNNISVSDIQDRIKDLENQLDETHRNFGYPDTLTAIPDTLMDPNELRSEALFRGKKGTKLDAFIKKWMANVPQYKFKWDPEDNKNYGITYFDGSLANIRKKANSLGLEVPRKLTKEWIKENNLWQPEMRLSLALARENTLETTYLTLLHEVGHAKVGNLAKKGQSPKEKAGANHGPKWFKETKKLFKKYFDETNRTPFRNPRQYHSFIPWKKVKQVERFQSNKVITKVFYDDRVEEPGDLREVVKYNPLDYEDIHYARIDQYLTRKTQRQEKKKLKLEIEKLKDILDGRSETIEMKALRGQIGSLEAQLDIKASEYIEDSDVKLFVELAKYTRRKVRSPDDIGGMISDICNLYSTKSPFKDDMREMIQDTGVQGASDWMDTKKMRSFHNYMEALVSIWFISDNSDEDTLRARSTERTLNGIPIALRYAMFLDGVHPDYLPEVTFESLKKFGKTINKKEIDEDILFPKKGTKQIGLYDFMTSTQDDFEEFEAKAESILQSSQLDVRNSKPRRQREKNTRTPYVSLYNELPDFLSMTKKAIQENTKPTSIPKQSAAECGLHAVNNLLGTNYPIQYFQKVNGTRQWFRGETLEIVLGNQGKIINGKWSVQSVKLCFPYGIGRFEKFPNHFMEDDNLVGFIFFLGPNSAGHWTSMKKWSPTEFIYMDSNKPSETGTGGLVKILPKDEMIQYILNDAKYGRSKINSLIALYKDEQSQSDAFALLKERESGRGDDTIEGMQGGTLVQSDDTTEDQEDMQGGTLVQSDDDTEEDMQDQEDQEDTTTDMYDKDKDALMDYFFEEATKGKDELVAQLSEDDIQDVRARLYEKAQRILRSNIENLLERNERFRVHSVSFYITRINNFSLERKKTRYKKLLNL